jgi:hypothetical protein
MILLNIQYLFMKTIMQMYTKSIDIIDSFAEIFII